MLVRRTVVPLQKKVILRHWQLERSEEESVWNACVLPTVMRLWWWASGITEMLAEKLKWISSSGSAIEKFISMRKVVKKMKWWFWLLVLLWRWLFFVVVGEVVVLKNFSQKVYCWRAGDHLNWNSGMVSVSPVNNSSLHFQRIQKVFCSTGVSWLNSKLWLSKNLAAIFKNESLKLYKFVKTVFENWSSQSFSFLIGIATTTALGEGSGDAKDVGILAVHPQIGQNGSWHWTDPGLKVVPVELVWQWRIFMLVF